MEPELLRYLSADGRAGRLEWLIQSLGAFAVFDLVTSYISGGTVPLVLEIPAVTVLVFLAGWGMWSVTFRRLHDLGKSGTDAAKLLVPVLNIIWAYSLIGEPGDPEANAYGPPKPLLDFKRP